MFFVKLCFCICSFYSIFLFVCFNDFPLLLGINCIIIVRCISKAVSKQFLLSFYLPGEFSQRRSTELNSVCHKKKLLLHTGGNASKS